jgi:hypothetical protein
MTTAVCCPHCAGAVLAPPQLAGTQVLCPHCRQTMLLPPQVIQGELSYDPYAGMSVAPPPPPPQSQPTLIVVTPPEPEPREKRLPAGGWFTRGFLATTGIVLALIVVLGVLPFAALFGLFVFIDSASKSDDARDAARLAADRKTALKAVAPYLRKFGVVALANDARVTRQADGLVLIRGQGRDRDGKLHYVDASFATAEFGNTIQWEIEHLDIDGKTCVP